MSKFWTLTLTLLLSLALAACPETLDIEDDDPDIQEGQQEPTPLDEDEEEGVDDLEAESDEEEEGRYVVEFESPYTYEAGGLTVEVTGIGFTSREWLIDAEPDAEDFLEDGVSTLVTMNIVVTNDSEDDLNVYPDQGQIVLGNEQLDPDFFLSDHLGTGPIRAGVTSEGNVSWGSSQEWADVVQTGEVRFTFSAPHDEDTFESIGDDGDMRIEWEPPS